MSGIFSGLEKCSQREKKIHNTMYELEIGWEHYDFQLVFIEQTTGCVSRPI